MLDRAVRPAQTGSDRLGERWPGRCRHHSDAALPVRFRPPHVERERDAAVARAEKAEARVAELEGDAQESTEMYRRARDRADKAKARVAALEVFLARVAEANAMLRELNEGHIAAREKAEREEG